MPITPIAAVCAACSQTAEDIDVAPLVNSVQHATLGTMTITTAADAATDGFAWLINPIGSGVVLDLRHVWFTGGPGTVPLVLTAPTEVTVERVTFTGVSAGVAVTPTPRDTAEPAAVGQLRTTSAGLTLAAGPKAHSFSAAQLIGTLGLAAGASVTPNDQTWPSSTDTNDHIVLRPGEGVVFRQNTAGATLLEDRTIQIDVMWDERTP